MDFNFVQLLLVNFTDDFSGLYATSALASAIDFGSLGWVLFFLLLMVYAISKEQWINLRKELQQHAMFDLLTGLPNRRLFEDRIHQAIRLCERREEKFTLILGDLDHFKKVNDNLGHHAGDELLKVVAQRLRSCIRSSDTIARLGGDEFAFVVYSAKEELGIQQVCERIKHAMNEPVVLDGHEFNVGISLGVAIFPEDGMTMEEMLRRADISMYKSKETRDCTYTLYTQELDVYHNQKSLSFGLNAA